MSLRNKYLIFAILSSLALIGTISITFTGHLNVALTSKENVPIKIDYYFGNYAWFFYFTNITNSLFVIITIIHVFKPNKKRVNLLQSIICIYMMFIALLYWLLLAPVEISYMINLKDKSIFPPHFFTYYLLNCFCVHFFNPLLATIIIFKLIDRTKINAFKTSKLGLIYPLSFYFMALIIYLITWKLGANHSPGYIYTFLNFFHPYGMNNVALVVFTDMFLLLFLTSSFFGLSYYVLNFKRKKDKKIKNKG